MTSKRKHSSTSHTNVKKAVTILKLAQRRNLVSNIQVVISPMCIRNSRCVYSASLQTQVFNLYCFSTTKIIVFKILLFFYLPHFNSAAKNVLGIQILGRGWEFAPQAPLLDQWISLSLVHVNFHVYTARSQNPHVLWRILQLNLI